MEPPLEVQPPTHVIKSLAHVLVERMGFGHRQNQIVKVRCQFSKIIKFLLEIISFYIELSSRTGTCPSTGNVDTIVIAVSMAAGICVIISLVIIAVMLACNMHLRRRLKQYPNKDK